MPVYALTLLVAAAWPASTAAQVRRCTASDGSTIFTDRSCSELGATTRLAEGAHHRAGYASRTRCMGSVQDLMFEMSMAFDAGDANRLAGLYHWAGMSSSTGYATIERLDRLVSRPLVDIVAVMPSPPEPEPSPMDMAIPSPNVSGPPEDATVDPSYSASLARRYADEPEEPAQEQPVSGSPNPGGTSAQRPQLVAIPPQAPPRPQRPVGVKVVQTLSNGVTPSSTVFGLTRHFGCWWIRN